MYSEMPIEELKKFSYPNLVAEIIESGCSIGAVAVHMGLPGIRKENDREVLAKLRGDMEITFEEAEGIARLFEKKIGYLFSHKLEVMDGKTVAHASWKDKKREEKPQEVYDIENVLMRHPDLLEFLSLAQNLTPEHMQQLISQAKKLQDGSID